MKSEKGLALAEALVALALMAILAVGLLSGLSTTLRAGTISQERVAAESLAKSQWEYIRTQDYIVTADYDPTDPDKSYDLIDIPYELAIKGYAIEIGTPQAIIGPGDEFELQSITLLINRDSKQLLTMSDYRVGRLE
jgi:type II secretory pathway pseudopilin PulG